MAHSTVPAITKAEVDRPLATSLLVSLRPAQWTKNLIVFAGLLFGQRGDAPAFLDPHAIGQALAAFLIFCGLSGVVYLINDVADRDADGRHPLKRHRPIASGAVSPGLAIGTAVVLAAAALAGAWMLRPAFALVAVTYVTLLALYSGPLKHVVIIDVLTIAIGFVLRAVAGAVAIDVPISHWLLILTILLALFLALSKRRHELVLLADGATGHRPILEEYSPYLLDQMIAVVTASTLGLVRDLHDQPGNRAEVPYRQPGVHARVSALRHLSLPVSRAPEGGGRQSGGHAVERPSPARLRGDLGHDGHGHHLRGSLN